MDLSFFIHALTDRVFAILPMREDELAGVETHVCDYVDSLLVDVIGACKTFPALNADSGYLSVVNTLQYLSANSVSHKKCRKEVLKMTSILNRIERECGGGK